MRHRIKSRSNLHLLLPFKCHGKIGACEWHNFCSLAPGNPSDKGHGSIISVWKHTDSHHPEGVTEQRGQGLYLVCAVEPWARLNLLVTEEAIYPQAIYAQAQPVTIKSTCCGTGRGKVCSQSAPHSGGQNMYVFWDAQRLFNFCWNVSTSRARLQGQGSGSLINFQALY